MSNAMHGAIDGATDGPGGATITVEIADPASDDAAALLRELDAEIARIYPGAPFHSLTAADLGRAEVAFAIARVDGAAAACGAVRVGVVEGDVRPAEIKRMYVRPAFRRRGLARAILQALERAAAASGAEVVRIETGARQPEAIALYRSAGYQPIPPFGEYIGNVVSRCFAKRIGAAPGAAGGADA
jgi:ribosomal protein S18 acetylase RimI-like enzyme